MMRQFHKYRTSGIFSFEFFSLFRDKYNTVKNNTCNYYIGYYLLEKTSKKNRKKLSKQILNVYTFSFIFAKFATQGKHGCLSTSQKFELNLVTQVSIAKYYIHVL